MAVFTFLVIVMLLLVLLKLFKPGSRLKKYGDKIPGPAPYPVIGNGLCFLTSKTLLTALEDLCQVYGPVLRLWLGSTLWICLRDPADIAVFLNSTKHLNKSDLLRLLDSWLGTKGLVTSNGDVWRVHRKLLTPSFSFKNLQNSLYTMQTNSNILCQQLQCRLDKEEFNILEYIEKCSLDIIGEAAMGVKFESQTSHHSIYLDSLKRVKSSMIRRLFQAWLHPELIFRLSSHGKLYYERLAIIKNEVHKIIIQRKQTLQTRTEKPSIENGTTAEKKEGKIFLDFLLTESEFTDEEVENEVQTFMFAGQDTIMSAISFCLFALAENPHVQEKCIKEIRSVLEGKTENLTYQDYKNLKYLENVIKETLRKYTPVPLIARKVEEDILLPSGYLLPAGSAVNFNIFSLHHDEKYFPEADRFIPERFESVEDGIVNFTFIPFSAGPRNCIGQKFALLEMKVMLCALLQRYQFLPPEKVRSLTLETGIVLYSLENIPVKIVARS